MVSSTVYATVDEFKSRQNITSDSDNTDILAILAACSRLMDGYTHRLEDGFKAAAVASVREYPGRGDGWLYIEECVEITALGYKSVTETSYTALSTSDYRGFRGSPKSRNSVRYGVVPFHGVMLRPNAAISIFDDGNYSDDSGLEPTVEVTAKWGYAVETPELIRDATIAQATIFFKRGKGAWADVLRDSNFGDQQFVRMIDPGIKLMLNGSGMKKARLGMR